MLQQQLGRIYYEIELMRRFQHPNILKIVDCYETKEKVYIVLELCKGGELFKEIRHRKESTFEEYEVATIIQQVLQGVNYMH